MGGGDGVVLSSVVGGDIGMELDGMDWDKRRNATGEAYSTDLGRLTAAARRCAMTHDWFPTLFFGFLHFSAGSVTIRGL